MSAPATNAFSPAPVRITARTAASSFSSSTARAVRSIVWVLSALRTLGRLMDDTATAPSRSRKKIVKAHRARFMAGVGIIPHAQHRLAPTTAPIASARRSSNGRCGRARTSDAARRSLRTAPRGRPTSRSDPRADATREPPATRANHDDGEAEIAREMPRFVGASRNGRSAHRGDVEDRRHVDDDRSPQANGAGGHSERQRI